MNKQRLVIKTILDLMKAMSEYHEDEAFTEDEKCDADQFMIKKAADIIIHNCDHFHELNTEVIH